MKLLIAEDDATMRLALEELVRSLDFDDVAIVDNGLAAWEFIESYHEPLLVISDQDMPGIDGLELCRRVSELRSQFGRKIRIIMFTGFVEETLPEAFEAGCHDFIAKPYDPKLLKYRLQLGRKELEDDVESVRDSLTNVWNRKEILNRLNAELARSHREGFQISIFVIDVDHFKKINDDHGHAGGDCVLQVITQYISSHLRAYDHFGRIGGEEFLIVLPNCTAEEAIHRAEGIRKGVEEHIFDFKATAIPVTVSMGVATSFAADKTAAEELLSSADEALYGAKGKGRNRVEPVAAQ